MRDYSRLGALPHVLPAWKLQWGFDRLRPFWNLLSFTIATKINNSYTAKVDLIVTKEDLDGLSDEAWRELEKQLS